MKYETTRLDTMHTKERGEGRNRERESWESSGVSTERHQEKSFERVRKVPKRKKTKRKKVGKRKKTSNEKELKSACELRHAPGIDLGMSGVFSFKL